MLALWARDSSGFTLRASQLVTPLEAISLSDSSKHPSAYGRHRCVAWASSERPQMVRWRVSRLQLLARHKVYLWPSDAYLQDQACRMCREPRTCCGLPQRTASMCRSPVPSYQVRNGTCSSAETFHARAASSSQPSALRRTAPMAPSPCRRRPPSGKPAQLP